MENKNAPAGEEGLDFSKFFEEKQAIKSKLNPEESSASQSGTARATAFLTKRLIVFLSIFGVLLLLQIVLLAYIYRSSKTDPLPSGYHLVTPPGESAHLEKNK